MNPEELLTHSDFVNALARRLVRDEHRAADLSQETWLAALKYPPEERGGSIRAWLSRVVRNGARLMHRREERLSRREREAPAPEAPKSPEEIVASVELRHRLVEQVLRMEEPYRSTILLRYYEGLSPGEIAKRLEVPAATVRTRLARGLERLKSRLDAEHGGDRKAWVLALAPFAGWQAVKAAGATGAGGGVGAGAGAGSASASWLVGALIMKAKVKIAIAAVVLVAAAGAGYVLRDVIWPEPAAPTSPAKVTAAAEPALLHPSPEPAPAAAEEPERVAVAPKKPPIAEPVEPKEMTAQDNIKGFIYWNGIVVPGAEIAFKKADDEKENNPIRFTSDETGHFSGLLAQGDYVIGIELQAPGIEGAKFRYPYYECRTILADYNLIEINLRTSSIQLKLLLPDNLDPGDVIYIGGLPNDFIGKHAAFYFEKYLTGLEGKKTAVTFDGLLDDRKYWLYAKIDECLEKSLEFEMKRGAPDRDLTIQLSKTYHLVLKAKPKDKDTVYDVAKDLVYWFSMTQRKGEGLEFNVYSHSFGPCQLLIDQMTRPIHQSLLDVDIREDRVTEVLID